MIAEMVWRGTYSKLLFALYFVTLVLVESRRHQDVQDLWKNDGTSYFKTELDRMSHSSNDTKGENTVPDFLGTAWMKSRGKSDLYLAGIAIGMDKNYALIHQDTYKDIVRGGNVQNVNGHLQKVVIPSPAVIQVQTTGFKPAKQLMKLVKSGLGGKPFNLVKILDHLEFTPAEIFRKPDIELNLNSSVRNCRAYSWAEIPGSPPVVRVFRSLPVKSANCDPDTGDCMINLVPNSGNICPSSGDRGIPVLCGPSKSNPFGKLTYLIHDVFPEGCVDSGLVAIHVASIKDDLDQHKPIYANSASYGNEEYDDEY